MSGRWSVCVALFCLCAVTFARPKPNQQSYVPPTGVHTAFGGNTSQISVMWHTTIATSLSQVVYWPVGGGKHSNATAYGSSTFYLPSAGYDHTVLLNGLKADTLYNYSCGSPEGMSQPRTFRTAAESTVRIAMYGDMGVRNSGATNKLLQQFLAEDKFDWIFHVGDISYADDYLGDDYEAVWNMFFENMQPIMSQVPYMVCPGNHEYNCNSTVCDEYSANFTVYNAKFAGMPGKQSGSNTSMWWSFDYANIHFIALSTETDYPDAPFPPVFGDQLAWLEQDLKTANSNPSIDWIVATGHRPMYSSAYGDIDYEGQPYGQAYYIQQAFEPLFHEYNVDLFVAGHVHSYQRTYPVYQSTPQKSYSDPTATVYIVAGAAGSEEGLDTDYVYPAPAWSAMVYYEAYSFGVLSTSGSSELSWSLYNSNDGALVDSFTITRSTED